MDPAADRQLSDVAALLDDWDQMSEHFLPGRGALLAKATDWAQRSDPAPTVIEIGSGPGTTLRALRRDLPAAQLVGIDSDPVLRRLHEIATPTSASITVVDADLSDASWVRAVQTRTRPTMVLAVQILHYFAPLRFDELLAEVRQLLGPGGVLVHLDHVPVVEPIATPTSARQAALHHRNDLQDPWSRWWESAAQIPILDDAFDVRSTNAGPQIGSAEYHPAESSLDGHLRSAGFRDVVVREREGSSLLTITSVG